MRAQTVAGLARNSVKPTGHNARGILCGITSRLLFAIVASAAVIAAGPVMGSVRAALQATFPQQYVLILASVVLGGVASAIAVSASQIRNHRARRFGAIALAILVGTAYSLATAVDQPAINAVERVHFLEYGVIGLLFYRAWRDAGDPSIIILPLLASIVVGTLDEWLQWFVPVRVGEARDVALNVIAVACGVLFAIAMNPPVAWTRHLSRTSRRRIAVMGASTVILFAAFFSTVHLARIVHLDDVGEFMSHYTAEDLTSLARDRQARWRTDAPRVFRRFSREDQYMDEGLWHVRRRNGLWAANDFTRARLENLVLERFFEPVLDTSTYALPHGGRWPAAQQAEADTRARPLSGPFFSDAEPYTMVAWPKLHFWLASIACAAVIAGLGFLP